MHQLISSPVRGNVGELKNQIKVMCATAWSSTPPGAAISLRGTFPGGDLLVVSSTVAAKTPDLGSFLPKALCDDVIFREFCHSGNILLLNRKLEQLLTGVNGTSRQKRCTVAISGKNN
jgi:transcriptional regulator with AAA-type ATPase domain